jgi:hypothetical protein
VIAYLKELLQIEIQKQNAQSDMLLYGIIAEVSQDFYKAEYDAYLQEKTIFDTKRVKYDQKNAQLSEMKNRII